MTDPNFASGTVWTGDNLPVMRGMNSASVDLIYLDPPFNSNRTYEAPIGSKAAGASFKDAWTLDDVDVHEHGELADRNPAAYSVIEASRQAHGKGMQSYLIFMAVRLLEMKRILQPAGSIYLHCDPTASHYFKLLMDSIFGRDNFRNEIVWKRSDAKGNVGQGTKHFGRQNDYLLFFAASSDTDFRQPYVDLDKEYVKKFYRYSDPDGRRYKLDNMLGPGGAAKGNPQYEFMGVTRYWRYSRERMQSLIKQGRVVQTKPGNVPMYKRYLDESKGRPVGSNWADISFIRGWSKEKTGYPTQKPLALLDRIIRASSNEGGWVFDPFCGCATALVAADRLSRKWAGVDLSPLAVKLVDERIAASFPGAAPPPSPNRPGARIWAIFPTTAPTAIGSMASRRVCVWAAIHTSRSASWTWITSCPARVAGRTMPITFNCFAPAAIGEKAARRWRNGGPDYDRKSPQLGLPPAGFESSRKRPSCHKHKV